MSGQQPHSTVPYSDQDKEPDPKPVEWTKDNSLPIIGLLSLAFLFCLVAHYSTTKLDWPTTHQIVSSAQAVVQTLALIVAGIWAYFKFNKERTYQERLIPTITGRFV